MVMREHDKYHPLCRNSFGPRRRNRSIMDTPRNRSANTPAYPQGSAECGISIDAQGSLLAGIVLGMCLCFIGTLFWYLDWVYRLPTPVPPSYQAVDTGSTIALGDTRGSNKGKPVFLHFFNPRCPCSRFNIPEVRALIREYGERVSFSVVVLLPDGEDSVTENDIRDRFGPEVTVSFDRGLAISCGVYSTPQAVIIDGEGKLFYRGNYNKNRYCTSRATSYARMALDSLLKGGTESPTDVAALTSYGCELPSCRKK
jgi:hypothetical protein